jgi:hypothetical protein
LTSYEAEARKPGWSLRRMVRGWRFQARSRILVGVLHRKPVPRFHVAEKVAFREDHPDYPGMYGRVVEMSPSCFVLEVFNPADLRVLNNHRTTTLEELQ